MCETALETIAREQWQADISGGLVADSQRKITAKKLLDIGLTQQSPAYATAYIHAQHGINPAT